MPRSPRSLSNQTGSSLAWNLVVHTAKSHAAFSLTTLPGRKLPEHDYLLTGTSYTLAATYAVSSLGQMQVSDAVAASTMHANVTHETTNEVLSMHHTDSQHAHVDFGNEGDAGEHILSSASDQDDGTFEDVTDVQPCSDHAAPAAAAAAETNSSIIDPGINGKSTEAWVAQFFAQSRLHYIGSWQQRCPIPLQPALLSHITNAV